DGRCGYGFRWWLEGGDSGWRVEMVGVIWWGSVEGNGGFQVDSKLQVYVVAEKDDDLEMMMGQTHIKTTGHSSINLVDSISKACITAALVSASLFFAADPALAFKGGGPYGADLSDADLRGADFSLANVTKVNLTNANLEGALVTGNTSFRGSIITGADFTDVPLREDQKEYLCKIADGVNPTTGNDTRETLFCVFGTLLLVWEKGFEDDNTI
ncbi:hypothetical protein M8C21_004947, partial [Ambrosia artemisiifolia]